MITHLRGRVGPGNWKALVAFLGRAVPFYEQPGGIRVRLLQDAADPDAFIEVIEYATVDAYLEDERRVRDDPVMREFLEEWRGLLAGPPEVHTFADVTSSVSDSPR